MFDVLVYLFETYLHSEVEMHVNQDALTEDLTEAGFAAEDIYNALNWLEKLTALQEGKNAAYCIGNDPQAMRIYTDQEGDCLDADCRGFLLFLEHTQILRPETREMVIDRVMALDDTDFDLDGLKWVVLMVLFNAPDSENAYEKMETLLFEVNEGYLH